MVGVFRLGRLSPLGLVFVLSFLCAHSICKTIIVSVVCVLFEHTKIQKLPSICILLVKEVVDLNFKS